LDLTEILESLKEGKISVDKAEKNVRLLAVKNIESACLDISRLQRKGVPEIVLAEGKALNDIIEISSALLNEQGRAIVSRADPNVVDALSSNFGSIAKIDIGKRSGTVIIRDPKYPLPKTIGKVGVLSAGTADARVSEEVEMILEELGCGVLSFHDLGIAGIQRLFPAVKKCIEEDVDSIVVVAGMEGALASIVSSLVSVPVIGVPTSSGYGHGGRGEGAIASMLQSCTPGLVVVNIDNGVGAAVAAALISKRISKHKQI